jgi:hypothetical protein
VVESSDESLDDSGILQEARPKSKKKLSTSSRSDRDTWKEAGRSGTASPLSVAFVGRKSRLPIIFFLSVKNWLMRDI